MVSLNINGIETRVDEADLLSSLLETLRERLGRSGTKEGCSSGDCGACTVIVGDAAGEIKTINSCITPSGAALAANVLTVEGISEILGGLHPVQTAMIAEHGAQCGFCTPGFVVSMVADQLIRQNTASRQDIITSIGGNLCRCTGYRPIIDAGLTAAADPNAQAANAALLKVLQAPRDAVSQPHFVRPQSVPELFEHLAAADEAPVIAAGTTDLWLRYTQNYEDFHHLIDITQLPAWRGINVVDDQFEVGAATTHADLLHFFKGPQWLRQYGALTEMLHRFGSPQIRARGTIGGNIANASPVADWPPILLALDAQLELVRADGQARWLPIRSFYQGYRQTALAERELISRVRIPRLGHHEQLAVFKISKRHEDDISSVLGAFRIARDANGAWQQVDVGLGGMAATPLFVPDVGALLQDLRPTSGAISADDSATMLSQVANLLQPISDVRATAEYRTAMVLEMIKRLLRADSEDIADVS